jgi:hypothetical protein
MPANRKALAAYLTDHMAGSVTASDLTRRGTRNNDGQIARFYGDLAGQIEADRRTLRLIAERVDVQPNAVKETAAMIGERVTRFKLDRRATSNPALSLLLELELLYLGIQGKNALWRALRALSASEARLAEFDFDELAARAELQLAAVDEQRIAAVARSFSG